GNLAAGRDVDGSPDPIERDSVSCRQSLDRADARNDLILERDGPSGGDQVNDPQGAVVERGIAPDQKGAALVFAEFFRDYPFVAARSLFMPRPHRLLVG